ncbi:hypothetical protein [Coprobacter tertius]|uniref:Fucose 4-O-acetylase and related acetyltransferases n=1 Tax=Coprobacter tertius TaxID=2944915 RepID=A0ABT1MK59_9BACT|nr:hypothetical protein [Coprobacter tertius]MCP9612826.1 hypothetical protein [Coprobacter tertius]
MKNFYLKIRKSISNLYHSEEIISRNIIIQKLKYLAISSQSSGISSNIYADKPLIISLTSYGKKIYDVYLTIESLLNQTVKPNKIILWLSRDEFSSQNLPVSLKMQEKRGLEIKLWDDLRSYKKIIPTLFQYPDYLIITVDDDIIYPFDLVESFLNSYRHNPNKIYCFKAHPILYGSNNTVLPYTEWVKIESKNSSLYNLPIGVFGVLYPANCFHEDVTKCNIFLDLAPYADDIWLKTMSLLKGIECEVISNYSQIGNPFISIDNRMEKSLARINVDAGYNDIQIKKIFEKYHIDDILKNK